MDKFEQSFIHNNEHDLIDQIQKYEFLNDCEFLFVIGTCHNIETCNYMTKVVFKRR